MMSGKNKNKIVIAVILGIGALTIVLLAIIFAQSVSHQKEIVSISNYPDSLQDDMKSNLEIQLRRLLDLNFGASGEIGISAEIRQNTFLQDINDGVVTSSFLIDIDAYKQTYSVIMSWSDTVEISDGILISCPEARLMKYPEVNCVAMYDDSQDVENIEENPIYNELPVVVDEIDFESRMSIHYEIRGFFNEENQLVIVINDYSGGNYEEGLNKIWELGYNPEDYIVQYVDQAGEV